ncbi:MAG TPA: shikimate dehydrogenase [Deltaproteobacteria bacterium]|nr:shikimate dehydrogenase [Deltaproteobacteria bacterium]
MKITGRTKVVGIFGDPVEHSISPYIHNASFEALGLDYVYVPFRVKKERLPQCVEAIRALNMAGVNVTIPHKESIIELLDELDNEAAEIGAVNTVVNTRGRLKGYNTDCQGYLNSLTEETGFDPTGKTIIVVGAGGAGRAVVYGLVKRKPERLIIANRTIERARSLAEEVAERYGSVELVATTLKIEQYLPACHLLVNTTSVGMQGAKGGLVVPIEGLPEDAIVSDIVYKPLDTPLIKEAERLGLRVHRGLGMLVHQAALSFELWTGKKPSIEGMKFTAVQSMEAL